MYLKSGNAHTLKIFPEYFDAIILGTKTFEIRKNDRDYQVGDELILKEWNGTKFTGKEVRRFVSYIYHGCREYGLSEGYCVLALKRTRPTAVPE